MTFSDLPFIRHAGTGTVSGFYGLRFCLVEFEQAFYRDALFENFELLLPPSLSSAVIKRRAEYLAGRYAAQQLLRESGCYESVVIGAGHAPQWPPGWTGSLSHTDQWAIAVISRASAQWRPGVDIENLRSDALYETADLFVTPKERTLLANSGMEREIVLLLAFSMKESLYKSLYPQVQRFLGFDAAEIYQVDPHRQRVTLRLTQTLTPQLHSGLRLFGYYQIKGNRIFTLVV